MECRGVRREGAQHLAGAGERELFRIGRLAERAEQRERAVGAARRQVDRACRRAGAPRRGAAARRRARSAAASGSGPAPRRGGRARRARASPRRRPARARARAEASRSQPAARISGCGSHAMRPPSATRSRTSCAAGSARRERERRRVADSSSAAPAPDVHLDRGAVAGERPGDRLHEHDARPPLAAGDDPRRVRHVALRERDDRTAAAPLDPQPQRPGVASAAWSWLWLWPWSCATGGGGTSSPARCSVDLLAHPVGDRAAPADRAAGRGTAPAARRACRARRCACASRSEPTSSARSSLLTTSRSLRVIPGPALARDVVAARHVDHEDLHVGERRAEDRGQVVAAALDQDEVERALGTLELGDRLEVRRDVVADRGVRAAARLDREDPLGRQHAGAAEEERVLGRVDVVGDDADAQLVAERAAERGDQRALAGADRAADADAQRAVSWQRASLRGRRGRASAARARARSRPAAHAVVRHGRVRRARRSAARPRRASARRRRRRPEAASRPRP